MIDLRPYLPLAATVLGALGGNVGSYYVSPYGTAAQEVYQERSAAEWREQHMARAVERALEKYHHEQDFSCTGAAMKVQACFEDMAVDDSP